MIKLTSKAIREQIADLQADAESLVALAEKEERDFTTEEQSEFDSIRAQIGEDGDTPTGQYKKLADTLWMEDHRKTLATKQEPTPTPAGETIVFNGPRTQSLKAFKGKDAHENAYKSGMWLKATVTKDEYATQWCKDNGVIRAAQTGSTDSAGGYTVPDPLSNALIEFRNSVGVARRCCDVVPMTSDVLNVPKITAGQTVYYPAQAAAITASDATFGTVALACVKRATLTKIANELLRDSVVAVADRVASRAGYELAWQEDNEFINGDGTSTYGSEEGIDDQLGAAGKHTLSSGETAWSNVVLTDFNSTVGKLPDKHFTNPKWIMRRDFYSQVVQALIYAAGGNTTATLADGVTPSLFGYGIEFTDRMPADSAGNAACFFGNFMDGVMIGDRDGVEIASSSEYAFDEDVTTLRSTVRYDIKVHEPGDGSNAGAYVGMYLAAS